MNTLVKWGFGICMTGLLALGWMGCGNETPKPKQETPTIGIETISLSQYQRRILSPQLYQRPWEIYKKQLEFGFVKYRIPFIKNGTITVEEKMEAGPPSKSTFLFEDSLLIRINNYSGQSDIQYNNERQIVKFGPVDYRYKNGKLAERENKVSLFTYDWQEECVVLTVADKKNPFVKKTTYCFNSKGKVIQDRSEYTLDDTQIKEAFYNQFDGDIQVLSTYVEERNQDTTVHHIVTAESNSSGLLKKLSTQIIDGTRTRTIEEVFDYYVLTTQPLRISRVKSVEGKTPRESILTFDNKGRLIEFERVGETVWDTYRVIYDET